MSNFSRTFGNQSSPIPLSYLDDNFSQLESASTSTVTLAGAALVGFVQSGTGLATPYTTNVSAYLNLMVKGLKRSYGCAGDGVTDDYTKIATALSDGKIIEAEEATFAIGSPLTINTQYTRLYGCGIQKTIFKRIGSAGQFFQAQSAGGVDSTKYGIDFRDFTLDGNSIAQDCLYLYDLAHFVGRNIEAKNATNYGLNMEMCVSPKFWDCKFSSNAKGARIGSALKATVEYLTNEANFFACLFNSNTGAGITLDRALMAKFYGGDCSANANGILLLGSRRCVVHGMWIENNTTDAINTANSASPSSLNCDDNEFLDNNISGTGNVTINNGTKNVISGYIAGNVTIAATITNTVILPNTLIVGTYTDSGTTTDDQRRVGNRRIGSAVTNVHTITGDVSVTGDGTAMRVETSGNNPLHLVGGANANQTMTDGTGTFKAQLLSGVSHIGSQSNHATVLIANNAEKARIDPAGNVVVNTGAIATNATDGFLYIPTCAGAPSGTPTSYTGRVAIVFDSTNNQLYVYDGGWLKTVALT